MVFSFLKQLSQINGTFYERKIRILTYLNTLMKNNFTCVQRPIRPMTQRKQIVMTRMMITAVITPSCFLATVGHE